MTERSILLVPPPNLSACLFAAILRDTRDVLLSDEDRFNFFPASPLVCVTHVLEGELHLVPFNGDFGTVRPSSPAPATFVVPPQEVPSVSWSPGPVLAVSIGIYTDAWVRMGSDLEILNMLEEAFAPADGMQQGWERFCNAISPLWLSALGNHSLAWTGIA